MLDLRDNLSIEDIDICDRVRLFKGDGPAVQLESGQQKGGYFTVSVVYIQNGSQNWITPFGAPNDYRRTTTESACRSIR